MRYRILGPLGVLDDAGRPIPLSGQREQVLLATLLLEADRVVSADRLIEALWGDHPPTTAANALQVHVSKLRKKLGDPAGSENPLHTESPGYVLRVGAGELDAEHFELLATQSNPDEDPDAVSARLGEALALWRGRVLDGLEIDVAGRADVARLEELRVSTIEARIEVDLALGRHAQLVGELEALVHANPLRERLRAQLMLALYRSGRQADALAVYRQTREVLAEELGIDPSPALQDLELAILNQSDELEAPDADRRPPNPPPTALREPSPSSLRISKARRGSGRNTPTSWPTQCVDTMRSSARQSRRPVATCSRRWVTASALPLIRPSEASKHHEPLRSSSMPSLGPTRRILG